MANEQTQNGRVGIKSIRSGEGTLSVYMYTQGG